MLAILTARATSLSVLWILLLACSISALIAAPVALVLKNSKLWGIVFRLAAADLALAVVVALLDRFGFGR